MLALKKTIGILTFSATMLLGYSAHASCSWTMLTNGTIANADQVMGNLDCLAPLANPAFTGNVGISSPSGNALSIDAGAGFSIFAKGIYTSFLDPSGTRGITFATLSNVSKIFADYSSGGTANPLQLGTWPNEAAITILSSGSVGIGTAVAPNRLEIVTPVNMYAIEAIADPYGRGMQIVTSDYAYGTAGSSLAISLGAGSGTTYGYIQARTDGKRTNGNLAFQVDGGNVGIGTTAPAQRLDVAGTIRQSGCTTAGTLSVNSSGDIICTSDARLKDIRGPFQGGLEAISKIQPMLFRYKPTVANLNENFVHAGFIAQNVKAAIPQASALQRDGYYSLDTTAVLAAAVNAIKELKAENAKLSEQVAILQTASDRQSQELHLLKAKLNTSDMPGPAESLSASIIESRRATAIQR